MSIQAIFVANLAATLFMVGLIWTIQIVHYPMFDRVGLEGSVRYAQDHNRLITWVVGPPMLIEMGTTIALAFGEDLPRVPAIVWWVGFVALILIWTSTWLLQVPCHEKLCTQFDSAVHQRLVKTNWIRTILWSFRGTLLCYALYLNLMPMRLPPP
ncbi:MAG: hypothetical protein R3C05_09790 [Pirellulaceae bacterium]